MMYALMVVQSFEAMVVACNIIAQKLDLVEATDAVVQQLYVHSVWLCCILRFDESMVAARY